MTKSLYVSVGIMGNPGLCASLHPQVCPMNMSPHVDPHKSGHGIWEEFSHSFTPAVREVVEFAKRIPGFRELSQHDQVSLLKAGTFEVHYYFINIPFPTPFSSFSSYQPPWS